MDKSWAWLAESFERMRVEAVASEHVYRRIQRNKRLSQLTPAESRAVDRFYQDVDTAFKLLNEALAKKSSVA